MTKSLKNTIDDIQRKIGKRMYETCLAGHLPDGHDILIKEDMIKIKRFLINLLL